MRWLDGIGSLNGREFEQIRELVMDRESWNAAVPGIAKSQMWLSNWTELTCITDPVHYAYCRAVHTICTVRWTQDRQGLS